MRNGASLLSGGGGGGALLANSMQYGTLMKPGTETLVGTEGMHMPLLYVMSVRY